MEKRPTLQSGDGHGERHHLRDLAALTALPSVWHGYNRRQIADSLADVLIKTLRLDFAYVQFRDVGEWSPIEAASIAGGPLSEDRLRVVSECFSEWLANGQKDNLSVLLALLGESCDVHVTPVGFESRWGLLVTACRSPDFLGDAERLLLDVVANQAATVLQQKSAVDALRQAEEFSRLVIESSPDCIKVLDLDGRLLSMSKGGQSLLEVDDLAPFLNKSWIEFWHGTDREAARRAVEIAAGGGIGGFEGYFPTTSGKAKWWDVKVSPMRDATGKPYRLLSVSRDVTARKSVEEALGRSEQRFTRFMQHLPGLAWIKDLEGKYVFVNDAAEKAFRLPRKSLYGKSDEEIFPAATAAQFKQNDQRALSFLTGVRVVETLEDDDGNLRHSVVSKFPIIGDDGKPGLIGGMAIDVTDQLQAEAALETAHRELARSDARKSAILETALDCIISMDHEGRVVEFNPAAEQTFGYRRGDVIGRELADLVIPPSLREPHRRGLARYLATGEGPVLGKRLELTAIRHDGTEFPVELAIVSVPTDGPSLFTAFLRDISELKRAEQLRNIRTGITHALISATSISQAARGVLQTVCEHLQWEVGFFWEVDFHSEELVCRESWHREGTPFTRFESASRGRTFRRGDGLPGRIWATSAPAWILDVVKDANFPRAASAAEENLHSAFGCPVQLGDSFLGVIEFFTHRLREPDADLLETITTAAGQFGQFIRRTLAENRVHENEAELADFFDNATIGLHWVGSDGVILRANKAELELLGYDREEYLGRSITEFHVDEGTINDMLQRLQSGDNLHDYPARLRCKDGSIKEVLIDSSVMWKDGRFVHTRCFTRDVTEQNRVEAALREAERRFKAVFNQQFQFMALLSPDGRVQEANNTCFDATGIAREQVIGRLFWETPWWHRLPEMQERWKQLIRRASEAVAPITGEFEYSLADGSIRHATSVVTALTDESGHITTILIEGQDDTERKQQEAAVRESEEKLRLMADTIPQLAWMARPDGHIFWYNRRWYDYTGKKPQEMEGWGWQSVHDPDVLPEVLKRWKSSIACGEPFDMVFPLRGADGKLRPFLTRINPFKNHEGRVVYWFGTNTDISELRAARAALVASEERLRLALEAGRMGVWEWNIRTGQINWSESLEVMHGLIPGSFDGTFEAFQRLIHPDDRAKVIAAIQEAVERRGDYDIEFRYVWPDGSIHWNAAKGRVFVGDVGEPERMIGICLDVTQRIRSENNARFLAEVSATLSALVDSDSTLRKVASLAVPYFADWATVDLLEHDGSLRRVAVAHTDPSKVQLAEDVHRRFPPDPEAPQGVWNILRTGRSEIVPTISDELLSQSIKDDELLQIMRRLGLRSYIGVPLYVRGKTLGVVTFISAESGHHYDQDDLSVAREIAARAAVALENAQLYHEVREADRRKDEFLATLAHELRNPLAPIRNSLQILKMPMVDTSTTQQITDVMERQVQYLARLVDDLLDVSRVMRGKIELRREPVELATVVARAIETTQPLIEAKGHKLTVNLPPDSLLLNADPVRLTQVFGNLLTNAAKYMEPNGSIVISAEREDDQLTLRVLDSGIGIAPDMLPHVFELFVQADHSTPQAQGGLGIGLTLVKNLVEMHQGTVEAHSPGLGKGSEFVVQLPLLPQEQRTDSETYAERKPAEPLSGHRLLVVDDNRDAADTLAMMLRFQGHEVRVANDGSTAIKTAQEFRPELILLDLGMPEMDGYEVARRLRQDSELKQAVLAALTGWGQKEDRRRTAEAGFDHHLVKPVEPTVLQNLLEGLTNPPIISTSRRILVVEDNAGAAQVLSVLLQKLGPHQVETAHDGATALRRTEQFRPQIILLDIGLPDLNGFAVAREIRRSNVGRDVLLAALTGYEKDDDRRSSQDAGFDEHLVKPVSLEMLRQLLRHPKLVR